jgi:hypothetical protein
MIIGGAQVDFDRPHIFIDTATSSTNIIHVYSLVTWPHRRIYGGRADGVRLTYIRRLGGLGFKQALPLFTPAHTHAHASPPPNKICTKGTMPPGLGEKGIGGPLGFKTWARRPNYRGGLEDI